MRLVRISKKTNEVNMLEPKLYDDFDKFIFNLDKTTYLAHKLAKTCEKEIKKQKMLQIPPVKLKYSKIF